MPSLRTIDALLGTSWRWDDDDDDAPAIHAARQELDCLLDELVAELDD
jgi:hypothetical protein